MQRRRRDQPPNLSMSHSPRIRIQHRQIRPRALRPKHRDINRHHRKRKLRPHDPIIRLLPSHPRQFSAHDVSDKPSALSTQDSALSPSPPAPSICGQAGVDRLLAILHIRLNLPASHLNPPVCRRYIPDSDGLMVKKGSHTHFTQGNFSKYSVVVLALPGCSGGASSDG